ncbi:hypothetical protein GLYMA_16G035200v4 [Glycine max]|uniref:Uncharacterized protein n=2 Tax=Glycine subgen. Soja TaxID=1462606 RepID=I1MKV6_SOYBN|nr:uncharacterized protein LOC100809764 [Glycine max]XP_028206253.1 uncharacterized protein LOC114389710 [Glycine soja]KAG4938153.1 hypothetical protein JHK86_044294 [Glycine max]KAG5107496.1 hypothetical protein JHK84_044403 [Glycine max]KAH1149800.1 hypothetical protein GYH30_044028 [Glycine max]KAH1204762.1 hypothetical protein GmHk_16G045636 [Glycine max]KRH06624.1 hypothetical protein GLYMA_16G035200v4 [Glycine max]|eukprot:XP_003548675.2 uncharacterized protein LOC100809764 [Glycine max]
MFVLVIAYLYIPASSALPCHPTWCGVCYSSSSSSKMQRNFMRLLMFFLCFSYVLSVSAIPATRTQNLKGEEEEDFSALPSLTRVDHALGNGEVVLIDMNEGFIERRVDLETQDYEGTGANKDHDPKSPGGP